MTQQPILTTTASLFYTTISTKGDKLNLILNLYNTTKEFINIPFHVTIDNTQQVHSPLTYSLTLKYPKIAKFLLDKGADVNFKTSPDEETPIHIAARNGYEEIVKLLIDNPRINLNSLNKNNETCFNIALRSSHMAIYNLIIQKIKNQKLSLTSYDKYKKRTNSKKNKDNTNTGTTTTTTATTSTKANKKSKSPLSCMNSNSNTNTNNISMVSTGSQTQSKYALIYKLYIGSTKSMHSPVLYINLSNEHKQHKLLSYTHTQTTTNTTNDDHKRMKHLECEIKQLKASNEELVSSKQQLQSTIDELEQKMKTLAKEVNI